MWLDSVLEKENSWSLKLELTIWWIPTSEDDSVYLLLGIRIDWLMKHWSAGPLTGDKTRTHATVRVPFRFTSNTWKSALVA